MRTAKLVKIRYNGEGHLTINDGMAKVYFTDAEFREIINWYILYGKGNKNVESDANSSATDSCSSN
jgi:hypothetical protein